MTQLTLLLAVSFLATTANAAPGEHIKAGEAVITPRVSMGIDMSTNPYHRFTPVAGDFATGMKLAPGVDIRLEGTEVDFDLGGTYELRKFFGNHTDLDRYNDFAVKADLNALKTGTVGIRLHEGAGIKNNATGAGSGTDTEGSPYPFITQTRNDTSGSVVIRPGDAFEAQLGGRFDIDDYAFSDGTNAAGTRTYNTRIGYGPKGGLAWKFFPRTAIAVDVEYRWLAWSQGVIVEQTSPTGPLLFASSQHLRATAGLRGRITDKLTVALGAGYGTGVFDEATAGGAVEAAVDVTGLQKLLVDLTWRYELSPDDRFAVGFLRDVRPTYFTNFAIINKGFVLGDARFTDRVGVNAEFNVRGEDFSGVVDRNDLVLEAKGAATYYMQDYASLSLGVGWLERSSSDDAVEYDDVQISAMANFTY